MPPVSSSPLSEIIPAAPPSLSAQEAARLLADLPSGLLPLLSAAGASAASSALAGKARPFTCGIINAKSGRCAENCAFCAQSAHHDTGSPVYPLVGEDSLYEHAARLAEAGVDYMGIVTSGTGPTASDFASILKAAERIRSGLDIKLCASLGVLRPGQAESLRDAGFTSYHHNLETAQSYYGNICTTHAWEVRRETVARAGAAGLRTCSGGIFGLGEGWEHRLELAGTLRDLDVDSVPVNFLTPIPGTPLEHAKGLSAREALAVVALLRLMLPGRDIVVCGGRGRTLGMWENSVFFAGANGLMVGDYLTTRNSPLERDMDMLRVLGLGRRG